MISPLSGRSRRGFTLVELLVVIAILALLIAILLPVLRKAKDRANSIKCMAQVKQIMTAIVMYSQENKNALPLPPSIAEYYPGTTAETRSLMFYMDSTSGTNGAGVIRYDCGSLWKYLAPSFKATPANQPTPVRPAPPMLEKVFNCPTDADGMRVVWWGGLQMDASKRRNFTYSFNSQVRLDRGYGMARKVSQVRHASHKIFLLEEWSPNDGICWIFPYDGDDTPAFRHLDRGNYGFMDGHAETMMPTELGFSLTRATGVTSPANLVDTRRAASYFNLTGD